MEADVTTHTDVARRLFPLVGTEAGHQWMQSIGFTPGSAIICCQEDDLVRDIVSRARNSQPPVIVAFLHNDDLRVIVVAPARTSDSTPQHVHRDITVGMLFDAASATGETLFQVNPWDAPQAATLPDSSGLVAA
jgi:hypothetical protein